MHHPRDIIELFNQCFATTQNTRLLGGAEEPLYQPATACQPFHEIRFTRDYFASALHEISHWLIAGPARRQQVDYGYWYLPDGRSPAQQRAFEQFEVKPQAMEWILSTAAGFPFRISQDNLLAEAGLLEQHDLLEKASPSKQQQGFKRLIEQQVGIYLSHPFPVRTQVMVKTLQQFYQTEPLCIKTGNWSLT